METIGLGIHFEDLPLGRKFKTVGRTITETDIVMFVNSIGMTEVLFTNIEFLKNESDIKGRVAPGSLVFGIAEGLLTQATMQGTGLAFLNMKLDITSPTFAGDTIHVECEVIEARLSRSRPERGLVRTRNRVVKQDGTVVHGVHAVAHGQVPRLRSRERNDRMRQWPTSRRAARCAGIRVVDLTSTCWARSRHRSWATWARTSSRSRRRAATRTATRARGAIPRMSRDAPQHEPQQAQRRARPEARRRRARR